MVVGRGRPHACAGHCPGPQPLTHQSAPLPWRSRARLGLRAKGIGEALAMGACVSKRSPRCWRSRRSNDLDDYEMDVTINKDGQVMLPEKVMKVLRAAERKVAELNDRARKERLSAQARSPEDEERRRSHSRADTSSRGGESGLEPASARLRARKPGQDGISPMGAPQYLHETMYGPRNSMDELRMMMGAGQTNLMGVLSSIPDLELSDDDDVFGVEARDDSESARSSYVSTGEDLSALLHSPFEHIQVAENVTVTSEVKSTRERRDRDASGPTISTFAKFRTDPMGNKYVNQYVLVKTLGTGTFGRVMLCVNVIDKRQYAIKVIDKAKHINRQGLRRKRGGTDPLRDIRREVAILKKLNHPNITYLHEVIEDVSSDQLFMVLEYCPGGPCLRQRANGSVKRVRESVAVGWIRDICRGLTYLHARNILHRDLKPANLLRTRSGSISIMDFGIAEWIEREDGPEACGSAGTPAFLAPEALDAAQFAGRPLDVWALGVCLYYFVYAKLPFTGFNTMELYRNIMHSEPDFDDHEHPISDSLKHLLRRLLQKDPSLRATLPEVMSHPWVLRTASSRGREFVPDEEWEAGVAMEASATPQVVQITQLEMDQAVRMDASGSMASIMDTSEAPRVTFKAGECVFAQNEVADVAYFIESGECSVVLAGAHSERLDLATERREVSMPAVRIDCGDDSFSSSGSDADVGSSCASEEGASSRASRSLGGCSSPASASDRWEGPLHGCELAVRGPGELVGEMALVLQGTVGDCARRTASVYAKTDMTAFALSAEQFTRGTQPDLFRSVCARRCARAQHDARARRTHMPLARKTDRLHSLTSPPAAALAQTCKTTSSAAQSCWTSCRSALARRSFSSSSSRWNGMQALRAEAT